MWDEVEAVILTGGASSRMGTDKASMPILGQPQASRILAQLNTRCQNVTSIGRAPIRNEVFVEDLVQYAGPLVALSQFQPSKKLIVVLSCDIPLFDVRVIDQLLDRLTSSDDVVLICLNGRIQPLIGVYKSHCWEHLLRLTNQSGSRLMDWIDCLKIKTVSESELETGGIPISSVMSANTLLEVESIVGHQTND